MPDIVPTDVSSGGLLEFEIASDACVAAKPSDIAALRGPLASAFGGRLSAGVLKQADDQSLVALEAIRRALQPGLDSSSWGLVVGGRAIGRKRIVESLAKFREQGAWSMSPHVIPHCSLHSVSGVLSQALGLHGPNIGVGAWAGSEKEAIWAGLSMLFGDRLPGVWIVLTGWQREEIQPAADNACQAAVLGLRHGAGCCFAPCRAPAGVPAFTLEGLITAIRDGAAGGWNLGEGVGQFSFPRLALEAAA